MRQKMSEFDLNDSLGALPTQEIRDYLIEIKDVETAGQFGTGLVSGQGWFGSEKAYTHTGAVIGFLPLAAQKTHTRLQIQGVSKLKGDPTIVGKRVKISLDKFYVSEYPGTGEHAILCEFTGKNQVLKETEELRYALRFKVKDQSSASVHGVPIFMGVTVGANGISFEGRAINVGSSGDETVLSTFDTPAFQNGLGLLLSAQPALKPFTSLATAVVKSIAKKSKNKQVHNFNLGLDFSDTNSSVKLQYGSYIVVQANDSNGWEWGDYEWNRDTNMIESIKEKGKQFPFNFMVFGVTPFAGGK